MILEELNDLSDLDATVTASEGVRFFFRAASGNLDAKIDPTHPVRDLVADIRYRWGEIDQIRVFVITEGKPRDELALSFVQSIGRALPCVHVTDPDADYEYALTAFPGQLILDLYLRYGTTLLEANIRTFLRNKRAVSKDIVETLRKEPEHFLAFNNCLVLVCDEAAFERTEGGNLGLSFLKGLQIVNGGQTTSTIYFSSRDDRTIDRSHTMVPAKIIILKGSQDEAPERLLGNVSRYPDRAPSRWEMAELEEDPVLDSYDKFMDGWGWRRRMEAGEFATIQELAEAVGLAERHVSRQLRLAYLVPEVLKRLTCGREASAVIREFHARRGSGRRSADRYHRAASCHYSGQIDPSASWRGTLNNGRIVQGGTWDQAQRTAAFHPLRRRARRLAPR